VLRTCKLALPAILTLIFVLPAPVSASPAAAEPASLTDTDVTFPSGD
jgi:hypothetical protein